MKTLLAAIMAAGVLCATLSPALAAGFTANLPNGDHGSHPPMAEPLSVTCPAQYAAGSTALFLCLRPGYVKVLASNVGLADGVPSGPVCHSVTRTIVNGHSIAACAAYH